MDKIKTLRLTGDEIGAIVTILNEMVDSNALSIESLTYDQDKATLYKIRSVRDEPHYRMIVTEE